MSFQIHALINQKLLTIAADSPAIPIVCLSKQVVARNEKAIGISITKDTVIITTQYALESESKGKLLSITNNINAYDWNGNHLWNIADIIGDLKIPYLGGTVTTSDILKKYPGFDAQKYDTDCELFSCSSADRLYIIDLNRQELIQVLETR